MKIPGYDDWKLAGPDEPHQIGHEDGETCNRVPEPDEDQPKGYRPKPCEGTMHEVRSRDALWAWQECDTCGEIGDAT